MSITPQQGWSFSLGPNDPNLAGSPLLTARVLRGSSPESSPPPAPPRTLLDVPDFPDLPDEFRDPFAFSPSRFAAWFLSTRRPNSRFDRRDFFELRKHPLYARAFNDCVNGAYADASERSAKRNAADDDMLDYEDAVRETGVGPVNEKGELDWESSDFDQIDAPQEPFLRFNDLLPEDDAFSPDLSLNIFRRLAPFLFDFGKKKAKDFFFPNSPTFNV